MQHFHYLASLCNWVDWLESYLISNLEDRADWFMPFVVSMQQVWVSHTEAHLKVCTVYSFLIGHKKILSKIWMSRKPRLLQLGLVLLSQPEMHFSNVLDLIE